VPIHIGAQSRAQLRQRWGDTGAGAILNNAATLLIYGGTRDADDLTAYSLLTGERDEEVLTHDQDANLTAVTVRRVPVLSPAQIAQLPFRRVVIIRKGMPPAIGRVRMAWKRHDVKAARRAIRWTERIDRWIVRLRTARDWLTSRMDTAASSRPVIQRITRTGSPVEREGSVDV
jgi:type IV secretory pathway TraG/TraD family ATPase VirD4